MSSFRCYRIEVGISSSKVSYISTVTIELPDVGSNKRPISVDFLFADYGDSNDFREGMV